MTIEHSVRFEYDDGVAKHPAATAAISADADEKRSLSIPDATTDQQVDIAFNDARLKSIWISSSQTITVKTNSAGTPQETFTIEPGHPLLWTEKMPIANPFAGNVTAMFVSNASGAQADVEIRVGHDSTP